jgi:hypothetical protein
MCGHDDETLFHSLMQCDHAIAFWAATSRFFNLKIPKLNPATWARDVLDHNLVPRDEVAVMITLMWTICHFRNSYTHGEKEYQPQQLMMIIEEIVRSLELPLKEIAPNLAVDMKWQAPDKGWIKVNSDEATEADRGIGGAGMIARDHAGVFLGARCARYDAVVDPLSIELLACRDAMCLSQELGFQKMFWKTDCQDIQGLWESSKKSAGFHILCEMEELSFQFQFASRQSKAAAHRLAKEALGLNVSVLNFDVIPGCHFAV